MPLVALKLFLMPVMISSVYFAGRRWGAVASGLLIGLPLTTGPISLVLACQFGVDFAIHAAAGNMAGQISICSFCLAYYYAARYFRWSVSISLAISSFALSTYLLHRYAWTLIPACGCLLVVTSLAAKLMPQQQVSLKQAPAPWWDLPVRIVIAAGFMATLTSVAGTLGPQLSGLLSTFPIFASVFAVFTQKHQGVAATGNLLRGIVLSSIGYATFFLTVGEGLAWLGIAWTYLLAVLLALGSSTIFYVLRTSVSKGCRVTAHC